MSQTITLPVTGRLTIKQYNADGVLIDERNINNVVVDSGKQHIRDRVLGSGSISGATGVMSYMSIGYGTGGGQTSTALVNEVGTRVGATGAASSTNAILYYGSFGSSNPSGATGITEAGLFNTITGSTGIMLARTTFSVINKGTADTLAITWTITIG